MRAKCLVCLFSIWILPIVVSAQAEVTLIELQETQSARDFKDIGEEGYMLVGKNEEGSFLFENAAIMLFDNDLNYLNSLYAFFDSMEFLAESVFRDADGNFLVYGFVADEDGFSNFQAVVILDSQGNIIEQTQVPEIIPGLILSSQLLYNDNLYIAGVNGEAELVVVKMNLDGSIEWTKAYSGLGSFIRVNDIQFVNDKFYIQARKWNDQQDGYSASIFEFDASLDELIWQTEHQQQDLNFSDYASLLFDDDGSFTAIGWITDPVTDNLNQSIIHYNADKEIEWEQYFGDYDFTIAKNIFHHPLEGYIISGSIKVNDEPDGRRVYIAQMDAGGLVTDISMYRGSDQAENNSAIEAIQLDDGDIILAGNASLFFAGDSPSNVFFVETTAFGVSTGIGDAELNFSAANVYPNPAEDHFYLSLDEEFNGEIRIELFGLNGQVLQSETFTKTPDQDLRVDLNIVSTNKLLLGTITKEGFETERFLLQRK